MSYSDTVRVLMKDSLQLRGRGPPADVAGTEADMIQYHCTMLLLPGPFGSHMTPQDYRSSDINPLDYRIRGVTQQCLVHHVRTICGSYLLRHR